MDKIFRSRPKAAMGSVGSGFRPEQSVNWIDPSQLTLKRSIDLVFSLLVLVFVCSWLFPIIALLIKAGSTGPVVFKQLRHGRNNIPFYCFKFRTMYINEEADTRQATRRDPRVTKIGALLRRTSLDELPQIWNVIRGEMSLVGPRPHATYMNEVFSEGIDNFMFRHAVKPGITGLAQSKGLRGEARDYYDIYSRCRLDLFYIKNWSPLLDLKIILWTCVSLVLRNKNAY